MMRWLCAALGHQGHTIMERGKDGRLWTRCINCWTVSPGIQIGRDHNNNNDHEPPESGAENPHGIERPL